jgi:predicted porin
MRKRATLTLLPGKVGFWLVFSVFQPWDLVWSASSYLPTGTAIEAGDSTGETNLDAPSEEAIKREQDAEEDPLSQRQIERTEGPEALEEEPRKLELYGSVRLRYRRVADDDFVFGDGGSRVGIEGNWQAHPKIRLFGRAEAGFNLASRIDALLDPSAQSGNNADAFLRLLYGGVETPGLYALFGKNWSTYYQVASLTDRLDGAGGSGTQFANAGTDGGATGTGRADDVLQTRFLIDAVPDSWWFKPFRLNFQIQHGQPVPEVSNANYGVAMGASAILQLRNEYTLGIAYNRAWVDVDADLRRSGIDGDEQAFLLGTRWFDDDWYLGLTVSRLVNHATTDEDIYFDGWGGEVYAQYRIYKDLWFTAGWNYLTPDNDQRRAGDYRVNYIVPGLRYTFKGRSGTRFYLNYRLDKGRRADGESNDDVVTIGLRWDLPQD